MFGQQARPFGSTFGSAAPTFGAPAFGAPAATPAFGAATPAFGGAPAFGASAAPTFGATTPAFGATTTPAFGSTAPAFGASATPAFGAAATPAFGAGPAFGAAPTPAFGAPATPAFGAPATPAFGAPAQPSTFGGFGATTQPTSAFGSTPAFGSTQPTTFGAPAATPSFAFGGATTFGAPATPTATPFGAPSTPSSFSTFGTPAATPASTGTMFGATTPTTSTFGGFGQPTAQSQTQAQSTGTGNPKFQPTAESDPNGTVSHQSITAMQAYNKKSFEELRWEDYQAGKKNASAAASILAQPSPFGTPSTPTPFGAPATSTAVTPFSFSTATPSANPFGGASTSLSTTAPTTPAFGGFGTTPATPTTSLFGAPSSTPSSFASPFGSSFGSTPATTTTPSTTGFGFAAASTPASSLFSAPATTTPFGTAPSTSPFGTAAPPTSFSTSFATPASTTPSFGAPATANPFGAAPTTATTSSLFSTTTPAPSTFGSSFSLAAPTANPFATATTPSLGSSLFNPPAATTTSTLFSFPPTTAPATTPSFSTTGFGLPTTLGNPLSSMPAPVATPLTTISSPPVASPLPVFSVPNAPSSAPSPAPPAVPIPPLTFTPRTPTPQKNAYISSYPRSLPSRTGTARIKDSPSYGGGRLFSDDKGLSPSGVHITPENLALRSATPSRPRVDIKKLNLPPFEAEKKQLPLRPIEGQDIIAESPVRLAILPLVVPSPSVVVSRPATEAPTLRNPKYSTKPSMDVLQEMSSEELSRVEDFTVSCEGLGSVRWHGKSDVRGLSLNDIVVFERKAVTVYPDHGIYVKPPVGEGLNHSATITLLHVLPKKQETAEKYTQMIANTTKKFDGKLLSYDASNGVWEFEVSHFSKYGLDDDEDDETEAEGKIMRPGVDVYVAEPASINNNIQKGVKLGIPDTMSSQATTLVIPVIAATTIPASFSAPPTPSSASAPAPSTPKSLAVEPTRAPATAASRSAKMSFPSMRGHLFSGESEALQSQQSLQTSYRKTPHQAAPFSQEFIDKETERLRSPTTQTPAPRPTTVRSPIPIFTPIATEETALVVSHAQQRLKQLALAESTTFRAQQADRTPNDMSAFMGRSFRVGWAPNGKLIRPSDVLGSVRVSSVSSTQVSSSSSPSSSTGYMLELLQSHLAHSSMHNDSHFVVKDVDANIQANIKTSYELEQPSLWQLVYALWGKPDFPSSSALPDGSEANDRGMSTHMVRKLLVGKWLSQALTYSVEDNVKEAKSKGNNLLAILHYISGRQISPAVSLAQQTRHHRLAVLLTQSWSVPLQLVGAQIEQWEHTGASKHIDPQLLAIYKLLAGEVEFIGKNTPGINEDWLRCFAIHFWYKHVPSTPIPIVLASYEAAVTSGDASAPYPMYTRQGQGLDEHSSAKDTLYRLLHLYASTSASPSSLPTSDDSEIANDPMLTSLHMAPSTSSMPVHLLLNAVDPANLTSNPLDFALSWHLYTLLRAIPSLSSVVDLPVPHRLHTSYAAQLEMAGHWQWAIYVLLHINFSDYKTVNGEWNFTSGKHAAVSAVLERHASSITDKDFYFLTNQLYVPASWVHTAIGRYLVNQRQYVTGVNRLLKAGEWNEAHRTILSHLIPSVFSNAHLPTDELVGLLETLQTYKTQLSGPSWSLGGEIYLLYFTLRQKLGASYLPSTISEPDNRIPDEILQSAEIVAIITSLCKLITKWYEKYQETASSKGNSHSPALVGVSVMSCQVARLALALAPRRDPTIPALLHDLPLPPDVRANIMQDYVADLASSLAL